MASSLNYVEILVIGTLLIVAGSMSVHEAVKDPADDKDVNYGLRAVAWITLLISLGGLVFYAPYYAHSRTNLLLAYVMQACAIFGLLISLIAIECSNNHPNSVTLVKPLKGMGGAAIFVGIAGLIVSVTALVIQNKSKVNDVMTKTSEFTTRKAREFMTPQLSKPTTTTTPITPD